MPPLLEHASLQISPELVLVDRELAALGRAEHATEPMPTSPPVDLVASDAREAMLRICELSDVNPPRARRRGLVLTAAVPAVLWAEAAILVASLFPFGAL